MAIRVRYKISVAVSSTSAEEKDLANQSYEVVSDAYGEGGSVKVLVAAGATDLAIQFPQVAAASLIVVRTKAKDPMVSGIPLTFKKGSTLGEAIVVAPLTGSKEGHLVLSTSGVTALYVSNSGAVDMEVTLTLVGD